MSQQERIATLLANADEAVRKNDLPGAAAALREASHLDPTHETVKDRWAALQRREAGGDALETLRIYIGGRQEDDGKKALETLKRRPLPSTDAREAIEMLLHSATFGDLLDALTGAVLSSNIDARRLVASKIMESPTESFNLLYKRGPISLNALASIPLENALWPSKEKQTDVQRDVFRLSIAKLIAPGAEDLDVIMRVVSRLLSVASDHVADLIDADVFDAIFASLDLRLEQPLRSQALLASSKLLEATGEKGGEMFSAFIHERVMKQTNQDLIVAFSAAAAVFPVIPAVASKLFLVDGFVQQLVPNLEKNWEGGAAGKRKSNMLETSALELLSAACVEKSCRNSIKQYCSQWLENLAEEREGKHKALAALVLAKLGGDDLGDMNSKLEALVMTSDSETDQAIEGLAYTTLQGKIKEDVSANEPLLKKLIAALKDQPSTLFGCLTVFSNLTSYKPNLTDEQRKLTQLKSYANSEKPPAEDPLDDDSHVTARCKAIMGHEIVPALVLSCKQTTSPTNVALVVKILLSLAKEQRHRALMAQQGAVKLLLQIRDRVAKTDKSTTEAGTIERQAAHALGRLLISINPSHIFSASFPASSAVSALVPLLFADQDSEYRDLLPTFEALLALTNLASMEDNAIRDLQLRLLWSQLEDNLLLSSNTLVQRASVELICNLMNSPSCVAKFVGDGSKREATRMKILLALADVEDLATRRAAGGALAMLTEWDAAVSTILDVEGDKGVKTLLGMCADDEDEMKHRGLVCVMNVVAAPGDVGTKGVRKVKEVDGVQILKDGLTDTRNGEILGLGVEVLKKLV